MIDQRIEQLADNFCERIGAYLRFSPLLALDYSWPSIGVLDLVLAHLRGKSSITPFDEALLIGSSAYLTIISASLWRNFDPGVSITCSINDQDEIFIEASGGALLQHDERYRIVVSTALARALKTAPSPFPLFKDNARYLFPDGDIVTVLASSIFLGVSPWGEGAWSQVSYDAVPDRVQLLKRLLATSTEKYLSEATKISVPHQILAELSFPPMGVVSGTASGMGGVMLADWVVKTLPDIYERLECLQKLASVPLENFFSAIMPLAITITEDLEQTLVALGESRGKFMPLVRPLLSPTAKMLGLSSDWISLACAGKWQSAMRICRKEWSLGCLPFCYLSPDHLFETFSADLVKHKNSSIECKFLTSLTAATPKAAIELQQELINKYPSSIPLILQGVHLLLLDGREEDAATMLLKLKFVKTVTPFVLDLTTRIFVDRPDFAVERAKEAWQQIQPGFPRFLQIAQNCCSLMIATKDVQGALDCSRRILGSDTFSTTNFVLRLETLLLAGEEAEFKKTLSYIARVAPFDRRLFPFLFAAPIPNDAEAD